MSIATRPSESFGPHGELYSESQSFWTTAESHLRNISDKTKNIHHMRLHEDIFIRLNVYLDI